MSPVASAMAAAAGLLSPGLYVMMLLAEQSIPLALRLKLPGSVAQTRTQI